ncbi:uncharacterized protein LOC126798997 [Argentina anserina]|uniref:uncharacterized protein LOC126798997 n=1 Tax=Argentina anserina TaxID=57926 RepID=UPI002176262F|nr:uncharacterized protein LOC126798997 [Potentilla anserina]
MKLEYTNTLERVIMSAEQLKHEESSTEALSCQMATELNQKRDIVAAHILVQMANEDSVLLHQRLSLHGLKHNMKGKPRMRWKMIGDRVGEGDSHSEVARRKANFVAKRQKAAVRGPVNAADSVVLALAAMPCSGKRKRKKLNIGLPLSSPGPGFMNCNVSEDRYDNLYEEGGYLDGHELTKRWGNNHQKSCEAFIADHHGQMSVLREENIHVAGPVNIPRHMKNDVREEDDDDLHEMWQVLDSHETTDRCRNNDQKPVGAGCEDHHDKLGILSARKRKEVIGSYFKRDSEDVAVPVKMPFKLPVRTVDRLHPVGSPPPPPLASMEPSLNDNERFRHVRRRRNIATFRPSSKEVRAYFHKEEALRYLVPDRGFCYTALDGRKSAVAPVRKKNNKCIDHVMLRADRPLVVSIYCLVRDAAARLPGGMGTRADVCTLMRDSQYLLEDVTDEQLHYLASKGLDRLHYEDDPCVRYDGKVWVYLHRNRGEDDFEEDAAFCTFYLRRK